MGKNKTGSKGKDSIDYYYADMHCHILPKVDDGSRSMEMTMNMIDIAYSNNISDIIVTPHNKLGVFEVTPDVIEEKVNEIQRLSDEAGYDISFYPGNELFYDYSLPERLLSKKALTLASSRYCLVEFMPQAQFSYIKEGLRSLAFEGFRPILAHCERYACLLEKSANVEELIRNRVYLQVNASSCIPRLFDKVSRFTNDLLKEESVSFISTDAHKDTGRAPLMEECAQYLNRKYDHDYVRQILYDNAVCVINDEEIE